MGWNGEGGPEAGALGAGRSGWAGAHGCPRRRPVCGPFPRLGFAARGRCGPYRETRQGSRVTPWRGKGNGFVRHEETRGAVSAGRLRLRGDDLPRSSSGGLLKRPPMGSGSRVTPWDSRRGPALACAQGTTSAGHLARRRAGGGRDASWRMRVAAVTCCEADDRVVHSAALRAATPRPRRPTTTRRRPTAVSTGARRRHNGASVSRTLTEYPRATPHALGVHHARLRGRSQRMLRVHVEFDRSAAWTRLGVRLAQDRQPRGLLLNSRAFFSFSPCNHFINK